MGGVAANSGVLCDAPSVPAHIGLKAIPALVTSSCQDMLEHDHTCQFTSRKLTSIAVHAIGQIPIPNQDLPFHIAAYPSGSKLDVEAGRSATASHAQWHIESSPWRHDDVPHGIALQPESVSPHSRARPATLSHCAARDTARPGNTTQTCTLHKFKQARENRLSMYA